MNFVIENYITNQNTQPVYLGKSINKTEGNRAFLWSPNVVSLYDIMDQTNPDFFITHIYKISKELVHYINNNETKTKILLCVDGAPEDSIVAMENLLLDKNIKCAFFFGSSKEVKTRKTRYVTLLNCYDAEIQKTNSILDYKIRKAYIVNKVEDIVITTSKDTYHYLSTEESLKEHVDIMLPEVTLSLLYKNYDEIIFKNIKDTIPQAFFDAICMGNKVYYHNNETNPDIDEKIENILKPEKSLKYEDPDKMTDFTNLKKYVEEKHTCYNRTKTLLSQLPKE